MIIKDNKTYPILSTPAGVLVVGHVPNRKRWALYVEPDRYPGYNPPAVVLGYLSELSAGRLIRFAGHPEIEEGEE
jgi:hypothetical protein